MTRLESTFLVVVGLWAGVVRTKGGRGESGLVVGDFDGGIFSVSLTYLEPWAADLLFLSFFSLSPLRFLVDGLSAAPPVLGMSPSSAASLRRRLVIAWALRLVPLRGGLGCDGDDGFDGEFLESV